MALPEFPSVAWVALDSDALGGWKCTPDVNLVARESTLQFESI